MSHISKPSIQIVRTDDSAAEIADDYFKWAGRIPGVRIDQKEDRITFHILWISTPAIGLRLSERGVDRTVYSVTDGYLVNANAGGEFSFERSDGFVKISLRNFTPSLPPFLYIPTHGLVHNLVMGRYVKHATIPKQLEVADG